jgi:hypothetical protein
MLEGTYGNGFYEPALHQVREPLAAIRSLQTCHPRLLARVRPLIGPFDTEERSHLWQCMNFWYQWNLAIADFASWRFRVESLRVQFPELCRRLGFPGRAFPAEAIQSFGTFGTRRHDEEDRHWYRKELRWADLLSQDSDLTYKIWSLGAKYGYQP